MQHRLRRPFMAAGLTVLALLLTAGAGCAVAPLRAMRAGVLRNAAAAGWPYRRAIRIDNTHSANALSNYQVKVVLDSANFDFDMANATGADVRFTDEDGRALLYHWWQQYDAKARAAIAWVKAPDIPASSSKTIYLYYGNAAPHALSNGMRVFDFFDDFGAPGAGYYDLSPAATVLTVTQAWENAAPHTLSVIEVNREGYRYVGYYGLTNCGGIGLARSNDLLHWDKYPQNPLYGSGGERWPSAVKVDGAYYMVHDRDYCATSYLVLRSSKDGLNFGAPDDYTVLIPPENGVRNQNANLFFDPQSRKFFLYWYRGGDKLGAWQIKARSAATAAGLADSSSERVIIEEPYEIAAPHMLYYDNIYFLSTEINENAWKTRIYQGASPLGPFVELPGNPILGNNEACFFQHVFSDTLHAYYCKDTGAGWVVNYRTADLSAGRSQHRILDESKWGLREATGRGWTLASDEADPARGVVLGSAAARDSVLWSSAFSGTDYTVDVLGKLATSPLWSVGVRADDDKGMYRVDVRGGKEARLALSRWISGSATPIAGVALGGIDLASWFTLTVKLHGPSIDVAVNGRPLLQASDAQFGAGRVALIGPAGSTVQFDDVLVRKYAPVEPALTVGSAEQQSTASAGWLGTEPTPAAAPISTPDQIQSAATSLPAASEGRESGNAGLIAGAALAALVVIAVGVIVWVALRKRA